MKIFQNHLNPKTPKPLQTKVRIALIIEIRLGSHASFLVIPSRIWAWVSMFPSNLNWVFDFVALLFTVVLD